MTKEEVLKDIDFLCRDIDLWTTHRVTNWKDVDALRIQAEHIIIAAHQELSFLRDYILENVKEE